MGIPGVSLLVYGVPGFFSDKGEFKDRSFVRQRGAVLGVLGRHRGSLSLLILMRSWAA